VKAGGVSVPYTVSGKTAKLSVTEANLRQIIAGAGAGVVSFDLSALPDVTAASLPAFALEELAKAGLSAKFALPQGSVTFDPDALAAIAQQAGDADVTLSIGAVGKETLNPAQQAAAGDNTVYDLSVMAGGAPITEFGGGCVTFTLPYTLKAGEGPDGVSVWYLDNKGNLVSVPCTYDAATGTVQFTVTHLSCYVVGYDATAAAGNPFTDVSRGDWFYEAVMFIANRGITTGTGDGTTFSPNAKLTRADFLVLMMRAYGIEPDANPADNFADAGDVYYTGYLAAAKRLGISNGVGDNLYAPAAQITRQEMFTLLYNGLKVIDKLPQGESGKTVDDFADAGEIAPWAKEAMTLFVRTGTVGGSDGMLTPTGTTTRAQMAQVLYNLLGK
ncbi:MAG TPA: S-layer homology domain-containing protein, partial [Candidatus Acidoferrum sp.]|nr:S-layer homology domain-containing protein [Candidatus Acidoferrum sp.]